MLSRSQVLAQLLSALRVALRDLPDGATGVRVYGGHESATVCVTGDGGELVVCTVRRRTAAAGDGRQLTIDDALASQASRKTVIVSAPAAVPVEEPAAVPVEAQPEEPAKAPLYFSFQPHAAADALASKRGRSMVFVYADGTASVEARTDGEEPVFFREYWNGACGWDSRGMNPEEFGKPAEKPKKTAGKFYRDQGHALDAPHTHPNVACLAGPGASVKRPKGTTDAAWRSFVATRVAEGPDGTWRLYSAKGKCLWDSRDGGAL